MSGAYVISPKAQSDLDGIWDFTEQTWGTPQAVRYLRQLQGAIEYVADDPRRGDACGDIRAGYFKYVVGSHVLFFRKTNAGVDIVRVLHGSMDFERHL